MCDAVVLWSNFAVWAQEEWLKEHDLKSKDETNEQDPSDLIKEMREGKAAATEDAQKRTAQAAAASQVRLVGARVPLRVCVCVSVCCVCVSVYVCVCVCLSVCVCVALCAPLLLQRPRFDFLTPLFWFVNSQDDAPVQKRSRAENPRVFFDVSIGGRPSGRIIMEVSKDEPCAIASRQG